MDHLADAPIANILILAGVIFLAVGLFGRVGGFIGSIFGNIEAGKNSRVLAGVLGACLIVGGGWLHEDSHKPAASAPPTSPAANASTPSAPAASVAPGTAPSAPSNPPRAKAATPRPVPEKTASTPPAAIAALAKAAERANLPTSTAPIVDDQLVGSWTNLTPDASGIKRIEIARVGQDLDAHIWHSCSSGECDYGIHRLAMSGTTPAYDFTRGNRRYVGSLNLYASGVVLLSIDILEPGTANRWHHNRVLAKSTLSEKTQDAFARYLAAPNQKAFAMAPAGAWSFHLGKASVDQAAQMALQHCQERGHPGCRVIFLNNDPAE